MDRLALWKRVSDDAVLLTDAAVTDPANTAAIARLRRSHDAEAAHVALQLTTARRKAAAKFGPLGESLVADPEGVEQATSPAVGRYKAALIRERCAKPLVIDACCGIGGDALAFTRAGIDVCAVDTDPVRAWMSSRNAGCPAVAADVAPLNTAGQLLHLDPARRVDGRRVFRLDDLVPSPAVLRALIEHSAGSMVKLGPGIDVRDTTAALGPGHAVFVSEQGRLVQALWLTGLLQPETPRTAVKIDNTGGACVLTGNPDTPDRLALAPATRYVFTVDPSVERAELLGRIGLPMLHPRLGLFTAEALDAPATGTMPFLTGFELLAEMAYRKNNVIRWLREHDAGVVDVKTRGQAVDPDVLQRELRGRGDTPYCVFVLRFDRRVRALITRRV